jgi:hypothetical protein
MRITSLHHPARALRSLIAPSRRAAALAICAVALAACGGDSSTGPGGGGGVDPDTPRSAVPQELARGWMYGLISPTDFWDDHTGQYLGNAYGAADYYTFSSDGHFTELVYIYTQVYSCRTQVWTQMEGTVVVSGSAITKYPSKGQYKVADTCSQRNNYTRPMTASELREKQGQTATWGWETDEYSGKTYLVIDGYHYDVVD